MRWLTEIRERVKGLLFRRTRDAEMDDELRFHLDQEADLIQRTGLAPAEARRQAQLRFGSAEAIKDEVRDARGTGLLDDAGRDIRYGLRMLRKQPAFTAMAVLSLAIGIGANTAIFSIVNAVLLRRPSLQRPEELVNLYETERGFSFNQLSYPTLQDLRDGTESVFSGIAVTTFVTAQLDQTDGVEVLLAEAVSGDFFEVLGLDAQIGRTIEPQDDVAPGAHPVVMLSHGYWQRAYAGNPAVVGRDVRLGGRAYTIIGVAPADYPGSFPGLVPAFYAPVTMSDELMGLNLLAERGFHNFWAKARLRPGVTSPQAEVALAAVAATLDTTRPTAWTPGEGFTLVPTTGVTVDPGLDPFIQATAGLLFGIVGLVLLLACANLASFLLARGLDRRREVAVRLALGASRRALVRQLLTESLLLGSLGGALGLAWAWVALRLIMAADVPLPLGLRLDFDLSVDWRVAAFTLVLSVAVGALLGLVPALQSTRPDVSTTLRTDTRAGAGRGPRRWRHALVVAQVTISLLLLTGAGLFLRSWHEIRTASPGFGDAPTALLSVMVPTRNYTPEESRQYTRRLLDRFRAVPGVEAIGLIDNLPLSLRNSTTDFTVDGRIPPDGQDAFRADHVSVNAEFFDAAGIMIVRGRRFDDRDGPDTQPVAIISQAMAQRFWPGEDPLDRVLRRAEAADVQIVGVARDIKVRTLGEAPRDLIYVPYSQTRAPMFTVVARTAADPAETVQALLAAGRAEDPELRAAEAQTMTEHVALLRLPAQLGALLLSVFGSLALALAAIGVYGLVSYAVATRTREVGIRMALGADAGAVARQLAKSGARLVAIGSGLGLALALLLSRPLSRLLFEVEALDPITYLTAPTILGAVALLAAYLPARRASRIDPVAALRGE